MTDPASGRPESADCGPDWTESWAAAPTGLADLDGVGMIIAANNQFRAMTGLTDDDLVAGVRWLDRLGIGSRLLYETQVVTVLLLAGSVAEVMVDVAAPDGSLVPALLTAHVLYDDADRICGTRLAVTSARDRRRFEAALVAARTQAEQASRESSRIRRRLELQAFATAALVSSTDPMTAIERLCGAFVPSLADWCLIFIGDPVSPSKPMRWAAAHTSAQKQATAERIAELTTKHRAAAGLFARTLVGAPATLITAMTSALLDAVTDSVELRELLATIGTASAIVAPSYAHDERVAVLMLVRDRDRVAFTEDDRVDVAEVAARTGIVIDNARRYAREHADSLTLQRSLLTDPPSIDGLEIEVRYLPAQDELQVGGDWYDAYVQPDGVPVVAIGDVLGHNIAAAAGMGQLRAIIRTIGYTYADSPGETLSRTDRAAHGLGAAVIASAILVRVEGLPAAVADPAIEATLRWSNAGHPPPALVTVDGQVTFLDHKTDLLLGVDANRPRHDHTTPMAAGDTLLLYTDGLVERAHESLDDGLARLTELLTDRHRTPLGTLCDHVIEGVGTTRFDDVALIAIRLGRTDSRTLAR